MSFFTIGCKKVGFGLVLGINNYVFDKLALAAANQQNNVDKAVTNIATGKRINSAKNDAAGLALSMRLSSEINSIKVATANAGQVQSFLDVADSAIAEVQTNVLRMREVAVQAQNGTLTSSERDYLQQEAKERMAQVNNLASNTNINDINLLDGTFKNKIMQISGNIGGFIPVSLSNVNIEALGLTYFDVHCTGAQSSILGTSQADILTGNRDHNFITGGVGNDLIEGARCIDVSIFNDSYTNFEIHKGAFTTLNLTGGHTEGMEIGFEVLDTDGTVYRVAHSPTDVSSLAVAQALANAQFKDINGKDITNPGFVITKGSENSVHIKKSDGSEFSVRPYSGSGPGTQIILGNTAAISDSSNSGSYDVTNFNTKNYKVGSEFPLNSYTIGDQANPSVVELDSNGFISTWNSPHELIPTVSVPQGFLNGSRSTIIDVAAASTGERAVVWSPDYLDLHITRHDRYGVELGDPIVISYSEADNALKRSISYLSDGKLALTYGRYIDFPSSLDKEVVLKVFDTNGNNIHSSVVASPFIDDFTAPPKVIDLDNSRLLVQYGTTLGSKGQIFEYHGNLQFDAASAVSGTSITIANHGLALDDVVTYSSNNGTSINGLTEGSTYHVVSVNGDDIELSHTLRGNAISLTNGLSEQHFIHEIVFGVDKAVYLGNDKIAIPVKNGQNYQNREVHVINFSSMSKISDVPLRDHNDIEKIRNVSIFKTSQGFIASWIEHPNKDLFVQQFNSNGSYIGEKVLVESNVSDATVHVSTDLFNQEVIDVLWVDPNRKYQTHRFDMNMNASSEKLDLFDSMLGDKHGDLELQSDGNGNVIAYASSNIPTVHHSSINYSKTHSGVHGQRYDSAGQKVNLEFQINTKMLGEQRLPKSAKLSNGDFIVTWASQSRSPSSSQYDLYGQRYDANSNKIGGEFLINTVTDGNQGHSWGEVDGGHATHSISSFNNGGFIVAWHEQTRDTNSNTFTASTIKAQRFDASTNKIGSEIVVNTNADLNESAPSVASFSDDSFGVFWEEGNDYNIKGQKFDGAGNSVGTVFQVNSITTGNQFNPSVTTLKNNNCVVVWTSESDGDSKGVYGQILQSDGTKIGNEFQVNKYTSGNQTLGRVLGLETGNFLVVWESQSGQDGSSSGIFEQFLNSAGEKIEDEFQINSYSNGDQKFASISQLNNGNIVVAWQSENQDGSGTGIFGQIIKQPNSQAVVWSTSPSDGGIGEIKIQKYDSDGTINGDVISGLDTGDIQSPGLTYLSNENSVLTYSKLNSGTGDIDIHLKILDQNSKVTATFVANSGERSGDYMDPSVLDLGNSQFLLKWNFSSDSPSVKTTGSKAQVFNYNGSKVGNSFFISDQIEDSGNKVINKAIKLSENIVAVSGYSTEENMFQVRTYELGSGSLLETTNITNSLASSAEHGIALEKTSNGFVTSWIDENNKLYLQPFDNSVKASADKRMIATKVQDVTLSVTKTTDDLEVVDIVWGYTDGTEQKTFTKRLDLNMNSKSVNTEVFVDKNSSLKVNYLDSGDMFVFENSMDVAAISNRKLSYPGNEETKFGVEGRIEDNYSQLVSTKKLENGQNGDMYTVVVGNRHGDGTFINNERYGLDRHSNMEWLQFTDGYYEIATDTFHSNPFTPRISSSPIKMADDALEILSEQRGKIGSLSNRMKKIISTNSSTSLALIKSKRNIEDNDYSETLKSLTKNNILQKVSTALMSKSMVFKEQIRTLLSSDSLIHKSSFLY